MLSVNRFTSTTSSSANKLWLCYDAILSGIIKKTEQKWCLFFYRTLTINLEFRMMPLSPICFHIYAQDWIFREVFYLQRQNIASENYNPGWYLDWLREPQTKELHLVNSVTFSTAWLLSRDIARKSKKYLTIADTVGIK